MAACVSLDVISRASAQAAALCTHSCVAGPYAPAQPCDDRLPTGDSFLSGRRVFLGSESRRGSRKVGVARSTGGAPFALQARARQTEALDGLSVVDGKSTREKKREDNVDLLRRSRIDLYELSSDDEFDFGGPSREKTPRGRLAPTPVLPLSYKGLQSRRSAPSRLPDSDAVTWDVVEEDDDVDDPFNFDDIEVVDDRKPPTSRGSGSTQSKAAKSKAKQNGRVKSKTTSSKPSPSKASPEKPAGTKPPSDKSASTKAAVKAAVSLPASPSVAHRAEPHHALDGHHKGEHKGELKGGEHHHPDHHQHHADHHHHHHHHHHHGAEAHHAKGEAHAKGEHHHAVHHTTITDPNKKWSLTRDWKLMGHEHEAIPDALFESLVAKCGLERRWRPMVSYLASLGLSEAEFERLAERRYEAFAVSVGRARSRLDFLEKEVGVKPGELKKMVVRHPQILEYRIERTMAPRLRYLESVGVTDLGKVVATCPMLLELSIADSLQPRVQYLVDTLGVPADSIGKVIERSPFVLTHSIPDGMQPRLEYFQSIGLSPASIARMVTKHPQVLHYSIDEGLRPRIEFLQSIGMEPDDIAAAVCRLTQLFSLSVEGQLMPKYEYLRDHLGGNPRTVAKFPAYFSLSLLKRIVPRHRFLEKQQRMLLPFPMKYLCVNDATFAEKIAGSTLAEFQAFRAKLKLH
eukprot:jgi/Mesvir1/16673/Mv15075-RA.1